MVPNKDKLSKTEAKWLLAVDAKNNPLNYNKPNTGGPSRYRPLTQKERKLCPMCQRSPVAINYHRFGIVYYKNRCGVCIKAKKKHPIPPKWVRSGYKKR